MYSVLLDENGYFTGSYADIGSVEGGIEVDSLPPDMTKATCYRLNNSQWEFDADKWEQLEYELKQADIREQRIEAFVLIDRYQLPFPFSRLSEEQKIEFEEYYQAWLVAPETMLIPERPGWMV